MKENGVQDKSLLFAKRIVLLYRYLCEQKKEYVLSKQILRSGTSIGANIAEAQYASSRKDFLNKLYIALKETAETLYWLELLSSCEYLSSEEYFLFSGTVKNSENSSLPSPNPPVTK